MGRTLALGAFAAVALLWFALFVTDSGVLISALDYPQNRFMEPVGVSCIYITYRGPRTIVELDRIGVEAACGSVRRPMSRGSRIQLPAT